jgi:hypothetical protein
LPTLAHHAADCDALLVEGLMTIGPLTTDAVAIRRSFRQLRELADDVRKWNLPRVDMRHLSMGMTGDFEIAIEEGATILRIGTAIFGPRKRV